MSGAPKETPTPTSSSYPGKSVPTPTQSSHSRSRSGTPGTRPVAFGSPAHPTALRTHAPASASSPFTRPPPPAAVAVSSHPQASHASQQYARHGHESIQPISPPTGTQPSTTTAGLASPGTGQASGLPVQGFVQPSSFLGPRPRGHSRPMTPQRAQTLTVVDREQVEALRAIRAFLKRRTSYDVLPLSFRLIIFDTSLLVKKSLNILIQNDIVSAPLWDSKTSTFAGLLTTSDYINVIQYYWQNPDALSQIDQFRLNSLREIEKAIGAPQIETVSIHPDRPLYEACRRMLESRARRIPLVDFDDETQRAMVVCMVTQYRILKFVSVNVKETQKLRKPLRELNLGTYGDLQTATMETNVMDVIHTLVKKSISSVPILDNEGRVVNVFEAVDVITLIKGGDYEEGLSLSVGEALLRRSDDFPGIYTCTPNDRLDTIFDTIRKSRVHRLVVIDEESRLNGILTLSDILQYILLEGESPDE